MKTKFPWEIFVRLLRRRSDDSYLTILHESTFPETAVSQAAYGTVAQPVDLMKHVVDLREVLRIDSRLSQVDGGAWNIPSLTWKVC